MIRRLRRTGETLATDQILRAPRSLKVVLNHGLIDLKDAYHSSNAAAQLDIDDLSI